VEKFVCRRRRRYNNGKTDTSHNVISIIMLCCVEIFSRTSSCIVLLHYTRRLGFVIGYIIQMCARKGRCRLRGDTRGGGDFCRDVENVLQTHFCFGCHNTQYPLYYTGTHRYSWDDVGITHEPWESNIILVSNSRSICLWPDGRAEPAGYPWELLVNSAN